MGQISNTSTYFNDDGVQVLVSGGAPAALSGPIHLCTRADNNNTRYFDGKVAYLGGCTLLYFLIFKSDSRLSLWRLRSSTACRQQGRTYKVLHCTHKPGMGQSLQEIFLQSAEQPSSRAVQISH